jgi:hypothetical protein
MDEIVGFTPRMNMLGIAHLTFTLPPVIRIRKVKDEYFLLQIDRYYLGWYRSDFN